MTRRDIARAMIGAVVLGSFFSLLIYARLTDLAAGVQAPLYALITAMGLAVTLGARAKHRWERVFNLAVQMVAIAAAALSAFRWLVSEDAGIVIEMLGAFWALLAGIAFMANFDDFVTTIGNRDHHDSESD